MELKIAIQGIEGSFHHLAALHYFSGHKLEIVPCSTFHEEVSQVDQEISDFCLMAMENTLAGNLVANYQLLLESNLFIKGEVSMHIRQHLIGRSGQMINELKEVHSHPVALNQCRHFLRSLDHIKLVENEDTAQSVKLVSDSPKKNIAAIGGKLAAELYGMEVLKENIEIHRDNYTRFVSLGKSQELIGDENKSTVYFQVKHSAGSLSHVLSEMSKSKVNMTSIHSMPIPTQSWEYGFFVDFTFPDISVFEEARKILINETDHLRVIGVYKSGETIWE